MGTVVEAVESHGAHSTQRAVAEGIAEDASRGFALSLAMVSDNLACRYSSKRTGSDVTFDVGVTFAPRIFLLVDVNIIVTIVALVLIVAVSTIHLFVATFVVIFFFLGGSDNLPLFFIDGLRGTLTYDDGLRDLFPDNNGLHLHLHGLRGLVSDIDGLGWGLWQRLGAEILGGPRVLFQFVGLLAWKDFLVALVVPRNPDLSSCWRGWDLVFTLILALDAILGALGRGGALSVVIVSDFASRLDVSLHYKVLDGAALFKVVAAAMDQTHLGFVRIFLEGAIGDLVAPDGAVATAGSACGAGLPLALALSLLVDDGHECEGVLVTVAG